MDNNTSGSFLPCRSVPPDNQEELNKAQTRVVFVFLAVLEKSSESSGGGVSLSINNLLWCRRSSSVFSIIHSEWKSTDWRTKVWIHLFFSWKKGINLPSSNNCLYLTQSCTSPTANKISGLNKWLFSAFVNPRDAFSAASPFYFLSRYAATPKVKHLLPLCQQHQDWIQTTQRWRVDRTPCRPPDRLRCRNQYRWKRRGSVCTFTASWNTVMLLQTRRFAILSS